jgi:glutathione reductase (NADPH)
MVQQFDLIVIGTGTAGRGVAMRCRSAGWRVAIVDHRPFGGTCALRGCDPKKVLVGGAATVDRSRRMQGKGVSGTSAIQWSDLIGFKRSFTDPVPASQERSIVDAGIAAFHGEARFTGPSSLEVEDVALEAEKVLIATGARPAPLPIPGVEHLMTSDAFLEIDRLPRRLVLVGGGYIAAEFSHIAARAGAEVTILQRGPRLLPHFDADLVAWLMERFQAVGIDVRTGTEARAIEKSGTGFRIVAARDSQEVTLEADLVVHAAGRLPDLGGLDLKRAGVAVQDGRLALNEYLQSVSNAAVYAAGDAAQTGPPLTPVASHDAKIVAGNLLNGNSSKPDYRGVPSVVFTVPPIAAVGLTEAQARNNGLKFRMKAQKASDWYTARQSAEPVYGFKVLVEEETDTILGAHLVGPHAEEVINLFALAIRHGLRAEALKSTMFAYPTGASDIGYMV